MGGLVRKISTSLHCEKGGMMDLFYQRGQSPVSIIYGEGKQKKKQRNKIHKSHKYKKAQGEDIDRDPYSTTRTGPTIGLEEQSAACWCHGGQG